MYKKIKEKLQNQIVTFSKPIEFNLEDVFALKTYLKENRITQKELAKESGITNVYLSHLLSFKYRMTQGRMMSIMRALHKIAKQEEVLMLPKFKKMCKENDWENFL